MRTFIVYMLIRLALFAGCFGVLWLLFGRQVSPWLVALLALLFTSGLSLLLFRRQGAEAGRALSEGARTVKGRFEAARSKEDVD